MSEVTWDAINKGSLVTLSNNNLTAVIPNNSNTVRATKGKTKGKWYWEVSFSVLTQVAVGVVGGSAGVASTFTSPIAGYYISYNGNKYPENVGFGEKYTVSDTIGVALDLDDGKLSFYKNGVAQGVSHVNVKTFGEVFPSATMTSNGADTVIANFGSTPFKNPIPDGYKSYSPTNKTLILHDGGYKKWNEKSEEEYYDGSAPFHLSKSDTTNTFFNVTMSNENLSFNGSSSYIKSNKRVIPKGMKAIRVKVKFNSIGVPQTIISETNGSNTHGDIILLNANGTINWSSYKAVVGAFRYSLTTSTVFVANKWYDILCTWDGTLNTNAVKIYVNDFNTPVVQGTSNLAETVETYNSTSIGRFELAGQYYLNGEISLLETYNKIPFGSDIVSNSMKYVTVIPHKWLTISSTVPTSKQFLFNGVDSPLLERKVTELKPLSMTDKSDILQKGEEGFVYSQTIDLKKYIDIRKVEVK